MNFDQKKINLAYKREQLALEVAHIVHRKDPNTGGRFPEYDCGVFAVCEIAENFGPYGHKLHIHFQGRKCDFRKFADYIGFDLKENDFNTSSAPAHKPASMCKLNIHDAPENMQIFRSKQPIFVSFRTLQLKGHQFIVPITAPLKPKIKAVRPAAWYAHPLITHFLPGSYDGFPLGSVQSLLEEISRYEVIIVKTRQNRKLSFSEFIFKLENCWKIQPLGTQTTRKSKKPKPSNSFRSAIKKLTSEKTEEPEQAETSKDSVKINKTSHVGKPRNTKHQGKAKTFKRKTIRRGRV